jgi:hypothetical protein
LHIFGPSGIPVGKFVEHGRFRHGGRSFDTIYGDMKKQEKNNAIGEPFRMRFFFFFKFKKNTRF